MIATIIDVLQQHEIERFYREEAAALDEKRFHDWLDLFSDDTHYWMPIRRTRTVDQLDKEFTAKDEMAYFDDDKAMLEMRVRKLDTGYSWSEDPPSRTRHVITNVRIVEGAGETNPEELVVETNFILYRTRLNSEEDMWVGLRRDRLRKDGESFLIAERSVFLDQTVLLSKNLSNFF
jgi:biphenyl 2,3-dioxygenase beta subunit